MIRAIIFDCFGVVYQSQLNIFLDQYFPIESRLEEREMFLNVVRAYDRALITKKEFLSRAVAMTGISGQMAERALFTGFTINQPILDYISDLRKSFKTGMLTNIGRSTYTMLEPQLRPYFDAITASCNVGVAKPDPEAYRIAATRLNTPPSQCLFVDDQDKQCTGAIEVGMKTILFTSLPKLKTDMQPYL